MQLLILASAHTHTHARTHAPRTYLVRLLINVLLKVRCFVSSCGTLILMTRKGVFKAHVRAYEIRALRFSGLEL